MRFGISKKENRMLSCGTPPTLLCLHNLLKRSQDSSGGNWMVYRTSWSRRKTGSDPAGIYMGGCFTPHRVQGFLPDRLSDHGTLVAQTMHVLDRSDDDWMLCCLSFSRRLMGRTHLVFIRAVVSHRVKCRAFCPTGSWTMGR